MRGTRVIGRGGYRNEPDSRPAGRLAGCPAGQSASRLSAEPVCLPNPCPVYSVKPHGPVTPCTGTSLFGDAPTFGWHTELSHAIIGPSRHC